ncbi:hypothetical protein IV203_009510 [Nitzschia inconspicua]|uniref:Uncharacterized protein n=1 Tax=Nitzschia inconspicua TaxID=303405 RepID=A0A9K3PK14_9STRA|nr:hypothetical protein IV203_009500 [Nitzschia inconspicua]KAG7350150.1 hypothetical protein IV203_009510 [Nitzschia inconspicua]
MQSSGAHARQMDAEFDDSPTANNYGLEFVPHPFNSAEAQLCEAQAQQQPTRPNTGTDLLNNRRRRQESNMFLAVRPTPPPTDNILRLHSAVRSIQHGTRKDNTKKAYDRKTQEYRELRRSTQKVPGPTWGWPKVRAPAQTHGLKASAIEQYKCAI